MLAAWPDRRGHGRCRHARALRHGPDASPFFRVFNPDGQGDKFDPKSAYRDHWMRPTGEGARDFAAAAPRSWKIDLTRRAMPSISLAQGRARALTAYEELKA